MGRGTTVITALALMVAAVVAQIEKPDNSTMPVSFFYSKPQSQAPALNVSIQGAFSNGYVFLAPYDSVHPAPYIYDKFGNLVWDGFGVAGPANAHDFHVCQYKGSPHLCFSAMNQQLGYGVGQALILDANYKTIATVNTGNNIQPSDMHEFQLLNDGDTALLTAYQTIPFDLSSVGITSGLGWLSEGVFQEVNVTTGEVLFEWFSSNHVAISDTDIKPNTTDVSGDGFTPSTSFDYFHINSVDKSASGNYLVSGRHVSTIYYVNSTDRSILWRLSYFGESDFQCQGFNFSFQHDARIVSENDTTTVISIFDNASNDFNNSNSQSSGMVISLDHNAKSASLLQQTFFPLQGGILTSSQGNTQILANGNVFHGWGNQPWASEHDATGKAVWLAQFATATVNNYRAFTFEWQSTPATTVPDVYSYAQTTNSSNRIYVSWNGATTVATWNFYGAQAVGDVFDKIGTTGHRGFETEWTAPGFFAWVFVEAVGPDGTSLRNSSFQPAFVPSQALAAACDEDGCQKASTYSGSGSGSGR